MEIMISMLYLFSIVLGICGIYFVEKKPEPLNGICSFFISIITFMCYQASIGFWLHLCGWEVSDFTIGIANYLLAGVCIMGIKKKKSVQKYQFPVSDFIVLGILAVIVVNVGVHQFGDNLMLPNYETVDYARHIEFARMVAVNHEVTDGRPFMAINSGLLFEALQIFVEPYMDYRIFIITDIFMLFLAGAMFWALIRKYLKDRFLFLAGILAAIFYMTGYPLNNMVCGTSYLGAGTTVSILIFILMDNFVTKEKYFILSLIVSLIGLLTAYTIFFPIVAIGVLVYLALVYLQDKNIFGKTTALFLLIFLCAACFASVCLIFRYAPEGIAGIKAEGFMYRNLVGDYVFLLPFVLYRIYKCLKTKEFSFDFTICLFLIAYIFSFLYAVCIGQVSTYYFYKIYYLFWIVPFWMLIIDIAGCDKERREAVSAYGISILLLFAYIFGGLNEYLEMKSIESMEINLNQNSQASEMFKIYTWNLERGQICNMHVSQESIELFQKVAELNRNPNKVVPYIGPYNIWEEFNYFALAYQWEDVIREHNYRETDDFIEWAQNDAEYICRIYKEGMNQNPESPCLDEKLEEYLGSLTVAYENEVGRIYKVNSSRSVQ